MFNNVVSVLYECYKENLNVAMLHMFYIHIVKVLSGCCIFDESFDCSMQHETNIAAGFFFSSSTNG